MRVRAFIGLVVTLAIAGFVVLTVSFLLWVRSRPHWHLSLTNTANGVTATVTTSDSDQAVYAVHVRGALIQDPLIRATRKEIGTHSAVKTTFYDDTIPPGRWTVDADWVKLDIMEARLIVNDELECAPGDSIEVEAGRPDRRPASLPR